MWDVFISSSSFFINGGSLLFKGSDLPASWTFARVNIAMTEEEDINLRLYPDLLQRAVSNDSISKSHSSSIKILYVQNMLAEDIFSRILNNNISVF